MILQMKKYILDKLYKSLFGDIVVFITAAALVVIVVVIEMKNDKLTKTEIKRQEGDCNLKRESITMPSFPRQDRFRKMRDPTLP